MSEFSGHWYCDNCGAENSYDKSDSYEQMECWNCGASPPKSVKSSLRRNSEDATEFDDINPEKYEEKGILDSIKEFFTGFFARRVEQFKHHFVHKVIRKKVLSSLVGIGLISIFFGILSILLGRNVDPIDIYILDPLFSSGEGENKGNEGSSRGYSGGGNSGRSAGSGEGGIKIGGSLGGIIKIILLLAVVLIVLFLLMSVLGSVFGVGGAWTGYLGEMVSDQLVGAGSTLEPVTGTIREAGAVMGCVFKGPGCMRQWRMNNTQRPGSEEVGQEYGLTIESFEIGQGDKIDVTRYKVDESVPISYSISNPRYGLKGIDALNVTYRVVMVESQGLSTAFNPVQADNVYCKTGWQPVNGFNIREDASDNFNSNDIHPGTSVYMGIERVDNFDFKNCEMLQPSVEDRRTVVIEFKYDYFSQATLYFDAMSQEHLFNDPNIEGPDGEPKLSETADTPVKAAIGVDDPVLYEERDLGSGDAARDFSMQATVNTDDGNLRYQVEDLKVTKSSEVEDEGKCAFKEAGRDNVLEPDEDTRNQLIDNWFTEENPPRFFGCTMRLSNPEDISPTGETLTMHVEANYTVALQESMESFEALNSECGTRYQCPVLVTRQFAEDGNGGAIEVDYEDKNGVWKTRCEGWDSTNGCSVAKGPEGGEGEWGRTDLLSGRFDSQIEDGEVALDPVRMEDLYGVENFELFEDLDIKEQEAAIGLEEDDFEVVNTRGIEFVLLSVEEGSEKEVYLKEASGDAAICEQTLEAIRNGESTDAFQAKAELIGYTSAKRCEEDGEDGS